MSKQEHRLITNTYFHVNEREGVAEECRTLREGKYYIYTFNPLYLHLHCAPREGVLYSHFYP